MKSERWSTRRLILLGLLCFPILAQILVAVVTLRHSDQRIPALYAQFSMWVLVTFLLVLVLRYLIALVAAYRHFRRCPTREMANQQAGIGEPAAGRFLPGVSIMVPAYNEGKVIDASIRSLLSLNYPEFEIVVIDDGSSDDTYAKARRHEGRHATTTVTVLTQPNSGKAAALNHGIRKAMHPFIMCVDADSKLEPDTLMHAIRHFTDPNVVAVAGNVKVVNRGRLLTALQSLEYIQGLNLVRRAQGYFGAVNIIPGPCGIFRKAVVESVGGYDTDTFAEDCDLTIKLLKTGKRIEYEPYSVAWTEAPEDVRAFMRQRYRWTRGILQSLRKHSKSLRVGYLPVKITLWYMMFEALIWPTMNIFSLFSFLYVVLFFSLGRFVVMWWMQLTVLDFAASMLCLMMDREMMRLSFFSLPYRFIFVIMTDICKMLASFEEIFSVEMIWGKLERAGRL